MSEKILIVDDQAVVLRLLFHPLEREGFSVITAMSGTEALEKIQSEKPDLVILDIMLPDISGILVCNRVRQSLQMVDLPIILLSGRTELEAKIEGLEAGADDYVTKPVDPKEMIVRVKTLLARTQRLRQAAPPPATPSSGRSQQGIPIAVIGAKGGVGVTTLVANLSAAMAVRGHRVAAAEMRPFFGALARQFGVKPDATIKALLEMAPKSINETQVGARLAPALNGLQLLLGPQQLLDYREIQAEQAEAIIDALVRLAAFVLIDLPHMPSVASRAALRSAQIVVLTMEPDAGCLDSARAWLELLRAWGIAESAIKLVVVNRIQAVDVLNGVELERILGVELLGTVTAAPDLAVAALNRGKPMVMIAQTALVTTALMEIADKLVTLGIKAR
ncbi:MAG: response regulator [Chloroflexota bacterium]|nr:response regulator [Chloroflexota bacterium]